MARRPIRHTDTGLGWVNRKFADLERQIREMRAEKRLGQSEVEEGGDLRIRGLLSVLGELVVTGVLELFGDLSMKAQDGAEMVRMGDMTYGRGLEFKRSDGTRAFMLRKPFETSGVEVWGLYDEAGNLIVEQAALGKGLGRPFLDLPFQPYAATSGTAYTCGPYGTERETSADAWETLFFYDGRAQNQGLDFKFAAMCSDATTAGEIRVVDLDTGVPRPGFLAGPWVGTIPAGSTAMTVVDPTPDKVVSTVYDSGVAPGDYMRLGVQVRRTAGTGSITLAVPQAIGG